VSNEQAQANASIGATDPGSIDELARGGGHHHDHDHDHSQPAEPADAPAESTADQPAAAG
jgi:hypothetical protein